MGSSLWRQLLLQPALGRGARIPQKAAAAGAAEGPAAGVRVSRRA